MRENVAMCVSVCAGVEDCSLVKELINVPVCVCLLDRKCNCSLCWNAEGRWWGHLVTAGKRERWRMEE